LIAVLAAINQLLKSEQGPANGEPAGGSFVSGRCDEVIKPAPLV